MRSYILFLALLCLVGSSLAIRDHWIQQGRAAGNSVISVRFALRQQNLDQLENILLDISDTTSPNYGKWKSAHEVTELVAPSKEETESVVSFLLDNGANTVEDFRDMIKVTASVKWIEEFLQTSLFYFQHKTKTSKVIIRAVGRYYIPNEIDELVDFVSGLYEFPTLRDIKNAKPKPTDGFVVPYTLFNLYGIPTTFPVNASASICLVEFQDDQSYNKNDLKKFATENAITPIVVAHTVGPYDGTDPDAESTLDVQYGGAIALNTNVWFWTVEDWMYEFATDFLNTKNPPLVVSMSWGWPEPNQCDIDACNATETSFAYVVRVNIEFQKIGAIGTTLLAASGDQGAPGDSDPDCNKKQALSTIFPGASPWVVSVGATMLQETTAAARTVADPPPICKSFNCSTSTTELVCTYPQALITTGGGFSDYVATPSYQSSAVSAYLSSGVTLPPASDFNQSNRGFPDVSALGHNYLIALSGDFEQVDGTSASTPVFGAIIALLNSYRLNNNKPPLGFAVPLLYQAFASDPSIFNDIATGNNKCTENCCDRYGYEAAKGWDPVTGLGTTNFAKLLAFVQTLP